MNETNVETLKQLALNNSDSIEGLSMITCILISDDLRAQKNLSLLSVKGLKLTAKSLNPGFEKSINHSDFWQELLQFLKDFNP